MTDLLDEVMGWTRSQTKAPDPEAEAAFAADAAMVRRVLSGGGTAEDGRAFLMFLARLSVLRPALDPALSGAASHDYAQRRTGANSLFAAVVHYLDLAEALERKPDHDGPEPDAHRPFGLALSGARDPADERFTADGWDAAGLVAGR